MFSLGFLWLPTNTDRQRWRKSIIHSKKYSSTNLGLCNMTIYYTVWRWKTTIVYIILYCLFCYVEITLYCCFSSPLESALCSSTWHRSRQDHKQTWRIVNETHNYEFIKRARYSVASALQPYNTKNILSTDYNDKRDVCSWQDISSYSQGSGFTLLWILIHGGFISVNIPTA